MVDMPNHHFREPEVIIMIERLPRCEACNTVQTQRNHFETGVWFLPTAHIKDVLVGDELHRLPDIQNWNSPYLGAVRKPATGDPMPLHQPSDTDHGGLVTNMGGKRKQERTKIGFFCDKLFLCWKLNNRCLSRKLCPFILLSTSCRNITFLNTSFISKSGRLCHTEIWLFLIWFFFWSFENLLKFAFLRSRPVLTAEEKGDNGSFAIFAPLNNRSSSSKISQSKLLLMFWWFLWAISVDWVIVLWLCAHLQKYCFS